jgi:photosystem II stability/assembly factor-like uncharacterized protein
MLGTTRTAWVRFLGTLFLSLLGGLVAPARAQVPQFSLQHAGTVFDAFTLNGEEIWTVEEGGRIRHRTAAGGWTFQTVADEVRDLLYRVQFLPDGLTGWAVGLNGWYLGTGTGGAQWNHPYHVGGATAQLWDVHFTDALHGWLVEQQELYRTETGSGGPANWTAPVLLLDALGNPLTTPLQGISLRSLDLVPGDVIAITGGFPCLGLMCAEPGLIFRTTDGVVWQVVFDIRTLCGGGTLPACMNGICASPPPPVGFEAWDIEISRNPTTPLALMVGGVGTACGLAFRSTDFGLTWMMEPHECTCSLPGCRNCTNDPLYIDNTFIQTDTWRSQSFRTLYSVSIFDGDNTAIACGYAGQHVVRNATTGVWEDRSSTSNDLVHAIGAVTTPMYATAADAGTATNGKGMIAGAGGFIRRTVDGGQHWTTEVQGTPWRVRDLDFIDQTTGWIVGQGFRIAKSTNGGVRWDDPNNLVSPEPIMTAPNFLSISMDDGGQHGVAVGQPDNASVPFPGRPKIRYTANTNGLAWPDPLTIVDHPSTGGGSTGKDLREVQWAGGTVFWTAGQTGLIYSSTDGGQNWNQLLPPGYGGWHAIADFDIQGLAFRDATTGIFVGKSTAGQVAKAYYYTNYGTPVWQEISPPSSVTLLTDVDIVLGGNIAYAIGVKTVGSTEEGVVLSSTFSGGQFSTFVEVPNPLTFPPCTVGDDLDSVPILNRVEVAPGGDVWVGGECGRVWRLHAGIWDQYKSQTDAHIRGLSFPLDAYGFAVGFTAGRSAWSVVQFHP